MSHYQERQEILADLLERHRDLDRLDPQALRRLLAREFAERFRHEARSLEEQQNLLDELIDAMRGFDILQPLLDDPSVTEIMVNGPKAIFIERQGRLQQVDLAFDHREHLSEVIRRVFGRANQLISEQSPIASLRLKDGSRVHAVLPPAAPNGPALAIRRFNGIRPGLEQLLLKGSLNRAALLYLRAAVRGRKNIFISGGTGTGKTTFLNALSTAIPRHERVITIEDTAELELPSLQNCLRLEARTEGPDGQGAVSLQDLIRSSLRLRPDRIIVGEVRGVEAFEMIQAMNTGHPGSMSTGHGNSPAEMLDRLSLMLLMASNLPWAALRRLLAGTLDILIQLERRADGKRQVAAICEIRQGQTQDIDIVPVFLRRGERLCDERRTSHAHLAQAPLASRPGPSARTKSGRQSPPASTQLSAPALARPGHGLSQRPGLAQSAPPGPQHLPPNRTAAGPGGDRPAAAPAPPAGRRAIPHLHRIPKHPPLRRTNLGTDPD